MAALRDDRQQQSEGWRGVVNGVALSVVVWLLIGAVIYTGFRVG